MRSLDDASPRVGALTLRRYRTGELEAEERLAVERALAEDPALRARLEALDTEHADFMRDTSFTDFAAGLERAQARAAAALAPPPRPRLPRRLWLGGAGVAAAALGLTLLIPSALHNRRKGSDGDEVLVRIGSANGSQREAPAAAGSEIALAPGERLRLGVRSDGPRQLVAVSIDEDGVVTPLYPERGASIRVDGRADPWLPDSLELTGPGRERVLVWLGDADTALSVDAVVARVREELAHANGDRLGFAPPVREGLRAWSFLFRKPGP